MFCSRWNIVQFYNPIAQIPAGTARRDALRLTKTEKSKLPRVTAYCTAAGFNLPALQAYLSSRPASYRTHPRLFDTDCLHTPYLPPASSAPHTNSNRNDGGRQAGYGSVPEGDLLGLDQRDHSHAEGIDESEGLLRTKRAHQAHDASRKQHGGSGNEVSRRHTGFTKRPSALAAASSATGGGGPPKRRSSRSSSINGGSRSDAESDAEGGDDDNDEEWIPDLFVFEYGTVVIWGMTEREEKRVLAGL